MLPCLPVQRAFDAKRAFEAADTNRDGVIDRTEFGVAMAARDGKSSQRAYERSESPSRQYDAWNDDCMHACVRCSSWL